MEKTFEIWLYEVCEHISSLTRKEITEVYSSINLTDARLAFLDGVNPEEYSSIL